MASSDLSSSPSNSSRSDLSADRNESDNDYGVVNLEANLPYQDELLANADDQHNHEFHFEEDRVGIPHEVLAERSEGRIMVDNWCTCGHCNADKLVGTLEYRCYQEINEIGGKLTFEGREDITGMVQHEDYQAMTNQVVLMQTGPLLRDRNGRSYRQRAGQSRNEYLRAVAYRWCVRWFFGYLGWDERRPLPACIYHDLRTRYPTNQHTGYEDRQ